MLLHSAEIKRTAMYLGLFAFVVCAVLRGRRVEIILGDRVSDVLHAYAAWAWGDAQPCEPRRAAVFCRIFTATIAGTDHVVARALRGLEDVATGNHWMPCVELPPASVDAALPVHEPCDGLLCGPAGGGYMCVAPLASQLRRMGWQLLPCQARGDCAIDCMTYWDGLPREPAVWKRLRVELAAAVRGHADCPLWQASVCASYEQAPRRPKPVAAAALAAGPVSSEKPGKKT